MNKCIQRKHTFILVLVTVICFMVIAVSLAINKKINNCTVFGIQGTSKDSLRKQSLTQNIELKAISEDNTGAQYNFGALDSFNKIKKILSVYATIDESAQVIASKKPAFWGEMKNVESLVFTDNTEFLFDTINGKLVKYCNLYWINNAKRIKSEEYIGDRQKAITYAKQFLQMIVFDKELIDNILFNANIQPISYSDSGNIGVWDITGTYKVNGIVSVALLNISIEPYTGKIVLYSFREFIPPTEINKNVSESKARRIIRDSLGMDTKSCFLSLYSGDRFDMKPDAQGRYELVPCWICACGSNEEWMSLKVINATTGDIEKE